MVWGEGKADQRTTVAAPEKIYKKNIVHPFCYLFRKQERERNRKQWTELGKLGLSPDKTVVCRKEEKY